MVSFVGYVNSLIVENNIMRKLPDAIFTQKIIFDANEQVLMGIAGEKTTDTVEREKKVCSLKELNEILEILRGYANH